MSRVRYVLLNSMLFLMCGSCELHRILLDNVLRQVQLVMMVELQTLAREPVAGKPLVVPSLDVPSAYGSNATQSRYGISGGQSARGKSFSYFLSVLKSKYGILVGHSARG
jgi:hypothetical protein